MAIIGIGAIGVAQVAGGAAKPQPAQKFSAVLDAQKKSPAPAPKAQRPELAAAQKAAAQTLDQLSAAQSRMDKVLELAQSGKTFSPAELLSLQAQVYRASQEIDLAGKVVEKATGGVKQVLQTQV